MWQVLRAELVYSRPWLLGGLGIAAGVVVIVSVVFAAVGEHGPPRHVAAGMRAMFLIMAPIIVGYIAQAYFAQERRARLLLAGPLTPRQLAGLTVLLPAIMFGIGVLAAALVLGADALATGRLAPESVHMPSYVGGLMFVIGVLVLLAQEATAAGRQRRLRAAAAGWASFVAAVLFLAALFVASVWRFPGWIPLIAGHVLVAVAAMLVIAELYAGRTDFTR
jgi:hypothetical protein